MISRREVVTAGVLGTLTSASGTASAASTETEQGEAQALANGFASVKTQLEEIKGHLQTGLVTNSLNVGRLGALNERIEKHLRSSGRFPEFCDIGTSTFYDVYEWHVRHQQQIHITRVADQRLAIQFMFTQLILRWENDGNYLGTPFDR